MDLALSPTVSPLEIVRTLANVIGIVVAGMNLLEAWKDLAAIQASKRNNGVLLLMAKGARNDQLFILGVLTCLLLSALFTLVSFPSRQPGGQLSLSALLGPYVLLSAVVLLTTKSVFERIRRQQVRSLLLQHPLALTHEPG